MDGLVIFDWVQNGALAAIVAFMMLCFWKSGKYIGCQLFGNKGKENQGALWELVDLAIRYVTTVEEFTNSLDKRDKERESIDERQADLCKIHKKQLSLVVRQMLKHEESESKIVDAVQKIARLITDPHRPSHSRVDSSTVDFGLVWLAVIADPNVKNFLSAKTKRNIALCSKRIILRVHRAKENHLKQKGENVGHDSTEIESEFEDILNENTGDTWDSVPTEDEVKQILENANEISEEDI